MVINAEKSASNVQDAQHICQILEENEGYKYLSIYENSKTEIQAETYTKIKKKVLSRVRQIFSSNPNPKNLFHVLNEHAIAELNYYIGLVEFTPGEYEELDCKIRKILHEHRIHLQACTTEKLYIDR